MDEKEEVRNVTIYQVTIENNNPNYEVEAGVREVQQALNKFLKMDETQIRVRPLRVLRELEAQR